MNSLGKKYTCPGKMVYFVPFLAQLCCCNGNESWRDVTGFHFTNEVCFKWEIMVFKMGTVTFKWCINVLRKFVVLNLRATKNNFWTWTETQGFLARNMTKQESFYICSENEHIYLFDLNIRSQEIETSFEEQRLLILQWRDFLHAFNNFLFKVICGEVDNFQSRCPVKPCYVIV